MRYHFLFALFAVFAQSAAASAIDIRQPHDIAHVDQRDTNDAPDLVKRKGGGGGGGRGGGGSSGGKSGGSRGGSRGSGSRPGSSGSSGGSSGSRGGSGGSGGSRGSGAPRSFGGGKFYGGGAAAPYKAGSRSPSGIVPILFVGAAALAFWPGVWLYGCYHYPYVNPYRFHNSTTDQDEQLPVICGCDPYSQCGCDENTDTTYIESLIGDGSYANLNKSLVSVASVNDTTTLLINGTLPNGTEPPSEASSGGETGMGTLEMAGYWPMVVAVIAAVFVI